MSRTRRALLAVAMLLAACASGPDRRGTPAPAPDQVAMRFGWQPGFEARVSVERERQVNDGAVASSAFAYTLAVQRAGEALRVTTHDYELGTPADFEAVSPAQLEQLAAVAGSLQPDMLVSPAGEFLGVTDLAAHRQRVHRYLAQHYSADASLRLQPVIGKLTSETYLRDAAAADWRYAVEAVAGATFMTGRLQTFSARQPATFLPGAPQIEIESETLLRRTFACERAAQTRTCAEFEMRWRADPRALERLLGELNAATAVPAVREFTDVAMDNALVLITEPDGLYPHRYEISKLLRVRYTDASGAQRHDQRRERTIVTFGY